MTSLSTPLAVCGLLARRGVNGNGGRQRLCTSCVLWRYARWHRRTPSQMYRVKERKEVPSDERKEDRLQTVHYNTAMNSLISYFKTQTLQRGMASVASGGYSTVVDERIQHQQMMALNQQENERQAERRKLALEEMAESIEKKAQEKLDEHNRLLEIEREEALKLLEAQKIRSANYVKRDDLQDLIEALVERQTDHCFAVDKNGQRYMGRYNVSDATAPL